MDLDTVFTVRTDHLEQFDEHDSVVFLRDLLWAEVDRAGIPRSKVTVSRHTKVPDRGIDASVETHAEAGISDIIQEGYNGYQIKAGKSFQPWQKAEIRNELFGSSKEPTRENLKEGIRHCVEIDGIYVLVCFGHDLTEPQQRDAKSYLDGFLVRCGYQNPRVDVWGAGQLVGFLRHFPSLTRQVNRLQDARFETHNEWSNHKHMRKDFVVGEAHERFINSIRDELQGARHAHIRVCGPPGIGKTKLALEATRTQDLSPLVTYFGSAAQFLNGQLFYQIIREDSTLTAIVVVDECDPQNRARIWDALEHCGRRIKVISIYGDYDSADGLSLVEVPPLENEQISEILESEYDLPKDLAQRWAVRCGGYPRVAHMVGWNLINNPEDILQTPASVDVWERFVVGGDNPNSVEVGQRRLILQYLALFKRFGYGREVGTEAQEIAQLIQERDDPAITWGRFQQIVKGLRDRKILQGENTLYISPKLLHVKLWIDWWDIYGDNFDFDEILSLPPKLVDWFFEMFEYAAGSEAASRTVQVLLGEQGPFQQNPELLKTERGSRFFRVLGEVEPEAAVRCLKRTIGQWSMAQMLEFRQGRRSIVHLLEHTAKWRHLFSGSARLLLALAEAENEFWSNNASGVFAALFTVSVHPQLSVTEAPPSERFPIVEEALQAETSERRLLAIKACESALQQRRSGAISSEVKIFGKQPTPWLPQTYSELFDVHRRAWHLLSSALDTLAVDERREATEALLRNMRLLGTSEHFLDMVMDTAEELLSKGYVDERAILEIAIQILRYDRGGLSAEVRERWEHLKEDLTGSDFASLLKRYVGMSLVEDSFDEEGNRTDKVRIQLEKLAQQAIVGPRLLQQELTWLVTENAVNGNLFGYLVGQRDTEFSLLEKIVEAQRDAPAGSEAFFSGGYLRALYEQDPERWEAVLDSFAEDERMQAWVPALTWRAAQLTDRAAQRLLDMVREGVAGMGAFRMFRYGGAIRNLSEDMFREWVEFLLVSSEHRAVYIALALYDRYYLQEDSLHPLPNTLTYRLLTHPTLTIEVPDNLAQGGIMESFHWDRVARALVLHYPERSIELAEVIIHHFGSERTIFSDRHHGPQAVLAMLLERYPEKVWNSVKDHIGPPLDGRAFDLVHWLRGRVGFGGGDEERGEGMLVAVPPELVWEWVDKEPEERAWFIARFIPPGLHREANRICWAREVLLRYGNREDVRNELMANFSTEGWTGPASLHYQKKREALLAFRQDEENERVRRWIDEYAAYLGRQMERARIQEERRGY